MGTVDSVPLASQVKSVVQASRGEREAAWATQNTFTQNCLGAAQVRSLVEVARGDISAAAETQRSFLSTTHRVLSPSEVADAVPLVSQLKSWAQGQRGEAEAAEQTRANFLKRCPVISQANSVYTAVVHKNREEAVDTQREFLKFASASVDKVPVLGHAKAWVHHALGDHQRGGEAMTAAQTSSERGLRALSDGLDDIFRRRRLGSSSSSGPDASRDAAGPLTDRQIRQNTLRFQISAEQCRSHVSCPICMQDFEVGDDCSTLRCFHIFHTACSDAWLRQTGNCPVCRVQAAVEEVTAAATGTSSC